MSTFLPLQWITNGEGIFVPGAEKQVLVRLKRVDRGYFNTLDIPVLTGRGITDRDREGAPRVIVINQSLAKRLADIAGIKNPVGKVVRLMPGDYLGQLPQISEVQIIGVIRSERTASPGSPDPPVVYAPLAQFPNPNVKLLVRSAQDIPVVPSIRKVLHEIDPNLPLADVATMQQIQDETLSGVSRPAWLIGAFASVAVLPFCSGPVRCDLVLDDTAAPGTWRSHRIGCASRRCTGARTKECVGDGRHWPYGRSDRGLCTDKGPD
jgi:MacB-like periplasmic core domain